MTTLTIDFASYEVRQEALCNECMILDRNKCFSITKHLHFACIKQMMKQQACMDLRRMCCFSAGLCSACVNCLCVPAMTVTDTALCPINAVPALTPSSILPTAAQPSIWPLNTDNMLLALRTVQLYHCCAATTSVEAQSGRSMLLSGRPATQTTAVHATAAKQVS